ncbi:MAG: hypothetical protein ACYC59_11365, partial [Anaerolineaceae bacterium]
LLIRHLIVKDKANNNSNLFLNMEGRFEGKIGQGFEEINNTILSITENADLRRLDSSENRIQITYYVNISNLAMLTKLMDTLRDKYPTLSISLIEQDNLLGG